MSHSESSTSSSSELEPVSPYDDLDHPSSVSGRSSGPGRSGPGRAIAAFLGFLLAGVLFLDPMSWHGLDEKLRGEGAGTESASEQLYSCSMHPQILESEPGICPICNMDLTPIASAGSSGNGDSVASSELYTCPMHPQILEEEPGSCPICGMDLVAGSVDGSMPGTGSAHDHSGHGHEQNGGIYTCSMHPMIEESEPGACPICGMDLVAKEPETVPGTGSETQAGEQGVAVYVDPSVVQKMNVRVETVERRVVARNLRSVGYLSYDPEGMVTVTPKYPGFVEKVYAHQVGEPVRKGSPLVEIYSPELVQTQQELLSAVRYARRLNDAPEDVRRRAEDLVQAARERMAYWDVAESAVDRLVETEQIFRTVTVHAPTGGVVMRRLPSLEGMAVKPGMELFHIADLSTLWMSVELFEDQLGWVGPGTGAEIRLSYFPEQFAGKVRFFEPAVDESTRTLSVRLEVPNPHGRLRVGMYAEVIFQPPTVEPMPTVPAQSVLRTGRRQVVVTALDDGHFAPRAVRLGQSDGEWVEVLDGLEEGEQVVTSAQFLIDSESNLRAAIQKLMKERENAP